MSSRAHRAALVWLCLWIYAIGGTVRTAALVLCVGEGKVTFTFAGEAGGCACCAAATCDDDQPDAGTPPGSAAHANDDCHCVDIPLVCGRDEHLPQHPGGACKHDPPPLQVAWLPSAVGLPPLVDALVASSVRSRAPPWSAQSAPELRRSVLLLV